MTQVSLCWIPPKTLGNAQLIQQGRMQGNKVKCSEVYYLVIWIMSLMGRVSAESRGQLRPGTRKICQREQRIAKAEAQSCNSSGCAYS